MMFVNICNFFMHGTMQSQKQRSRGETQGKLLLNRVVDEGDALADVVLETLDGGLQELLLLICDAVEDVDSFFGTIGL
jgi:hypothetical protein